MSGKQVSQSECALVFGVHRNTVASWLKKGCPFVQKANKKQGKDWILDTASVAQWRADRAVQDAVGDTDDASEDELQRRKLAAETAKAEIEVAKLKGEVIEIDFISQIVANDYITIKQRLRQIPTRVSPLIVGEDDEARIKEVILSEVDDALTELANEYSEFSEGNSEEEDLTEATA